MAWPYGFLTAWYSGISGCDELKCNKIVVYENMYFTKCVHVGPSKNGGLANAGLCMK